MLEQEQRKKVAVVIYEELLNLQSKFLYWCENRDFWDEKLSGARENLNDEEGATHTLYNGWREARQECAASADTSYKQWLKILKVLEGYADVMPDLGIFPEDPGHSIFLRTNNFTKEKDFFA